MGKLGQKLAATGHLFGIFPGFSGQLVDIFHILAHFGGYRGLLICCGGNLAIHAIELMDRVGNTGKSLFGVGYLFGGVVGHIPALLHHVDCMGNFQAQLFNHGADFTRGLLGTTGQASHLIGYHSKAAPLLTGARRLDGGIERQQIGLLGNTADHICDGTDLLAMVGHIGHHLAGTFDLVGQGADHVPGLAGHGQAIAGGIQGGLGLLSGCFGIIGHLAYRGAHLLHGGSNLSGLALLGIHGGQGVFTGCRELLG